MDGLRYYVGSLLLIACGIHGAEEQSARSKKQSHNILITIPLPKGKLYSSSHTFRIPEVTTIAALRETFEKQILELAHKTPTCSCGGPCADIRAAQTIVAYLETHKDKTLQVAYLGAKADDTATLESLGFDAKQDTLYAKY